MQLSHFFTATKTCPTLEIHVSDDVRQREATRSKQSVTIHEKSRKA